MKLLVISGRSGSGKTIALHVLEDLGYCCIDGIPFQLLEQLIDTVSTKHKKVAITLDIRNLPSQASEIKTLFSTLENKS